MKNDNPYVLLLFLLLGVGYLYLHFRTKSGFKYLKSKFGRNVGEIYGHSSVNQLVGELSTKTQNGLSVKDSTIIAIEGNEFPLVYRSVIYANYHHTRTSATSAYFLITDQANKHLIDTHPNLFEFSEKAGEYSVYWATNIKGLVAFQNSTVSKNLSNMWNTGQEEKASPNPISSLAAIPPLSDIRTILRNYPELYVDETPDSIAVHPNDYNGFTVRLKVEKDSYILSYGKWHEYLPKSEIGQKVALELFKFGLSDSCRLSVHQKGGIEHKCVLSYRNQQTGQWEVVAKQTLFLHSFWETENVRYLQNHVIEGIEISKLFDSDEFEKAITEITYDRKYTKYALIYTSIWLGTFLKLNNYDLGNIQVSLLLLFPVIVFTLLLPILIMRNWFIDRKLGKTKKLILNTRQRKFVFIWIAIWFLSFLIISTLWGAGNLLVLFILGFPFILVGFSIPIYIMMERK